MKSIGHSETEAWVFAAICLAAGITASAQEAADTACKGFVVVTDTVQADGKTDVSDAIQRLIDANPNRTIYFPDGVYLLGKPVMTPADPRRSVDLQLANYAVLKAADNWSSSEAMVRLGAIHPANDIRTDGSNYTLTGGIIDGNNVASAVSIDGGRETAIRNVSIKHARIGIHIKPGANSGSSDADIHSVNITGNKTRESIGVLVEGYDNTLTNMRIADMETGILVKSGGNILRNIHPLFTGPWEHFESSCGFADASSGNNWYDFCYADNFATAFLTAGDISNIYDNCFAYWYSPRGKKHVLFRAEGTFGSMVTRLKAGFRGKSAKNVILEVGKPGGRGFFDTLHVLDPSLVNETERVFEKYLRNGLF